MFPRGFVILRMDHERLQRTQEEEKQLQIERKEELDTLIESLELELLHKLSKDKKRLDSLKDERDFYYEKLCRIEQVRKPLLTFRN